MTSAIFQGKGDVPVSKDGLIIVVSVGRIALEFYRSQELCLSALLKPYLGFAYIPRYEMQIVLIRRAFLA